MFAGPKPRLLAVFASFAAYAAASAALYTRHAEGAGASILAVRHVLLLPSLWWLISHYRGGGKPSLWLPSWRAQTVFFLCGAAPLAWIWSRGQTVSDESAYRFQARIFSSGRLTAEAMPIAAVNAKDGRETPFAGAVTFNGRWFAKYPPGWPLALATAGMIRADWVISLLLSGGILLLTGAIARRLFGLGAARLSVLLLIASPFYLYNSMGYLSHPLSGLLIAGATYLLISGIQSNRAWPFWAMFAVLATATQVRPYTAACAGLVLGSAALWSVRKNRTRLAHGVAGALLFAVCSAALMAAWNHALTGSYWLSPYAMARGTALPVEISPTLPILQRNLLYNTRWSLEATAVYSFPLLFLLAAWSVLRERRARFEGRVLALLFVAMVAGYLVQPEWSTCRYGERYYFEAFFGVAILAARRIESFWAISPKGASIGLAALAGIQVFTLAVFTPRVLSNTYYLAAVQKNFAKVDASGTVVFLADKPEGNYIDAARNFNPNAADWRHAPAVFLPDPGAPLRAETARRLGRSRWVVLGEALASGAGND